MKLTLLDIVQQCLYDLDSENVNSIGDSIEAEQVVSIIERVYFDVVSTRDIPEHRELIKLTAASDSEYPTHFQYPTNVKRIEKVWYKDSDGAYKEVTFLEPLDFLTKTDRYSEDYITVNDKNAGTTLRILNDRTPKYYTSFDDYWIVMDSYVATEDSTLQESKVRAYGIKVPTFSRADDFIPDLDNELFPYFVNESRAQVMSLLKGGADPKVEQAARRQKSFMQNDMYKTRPKRALSNYGRK